MLWWDSVTLRGEIWSLKFLDLSDWIWYYIMYNNYKPLPIGWIMNLFSLSLIISVIILSISTYHLFKKLKEISFIIHHIYTQIKILEDSIYGIRSSSIPYVEYNIQNLYNSLQDLKKEMGTLWYIVQKLKTYLPLFLKLKKNLNRYLKLGIIHSLNPTTLRGRII